MRHFKFIILSIVSIFLLAACGPVYETDYTYVNPKSFSGKKCVRQCLTQRTGCRQSCQRQYNSCQAQAATMSELDYRISQVIAKDKKHSNPQPYRRSYDSHCTNNCGCTETYNTCFSTCGGQIIPHTRCVAFCDKK